MSPTLNKACTPSLLLVPALMNVFLPAILGPLVVAVLGIEQLLPQNVDLLVKFLVFLIPVFLHCFSKLT